MKYILIWIILLPNTVEFGSQDPVRSDRVLTSGSAQFDTMGACLDALDEIRVLENAWKDDRPLMITTCTPTQPLDDSFGGCYDNAGSDREARLRCYERR